MTKIGVDIDHAVSLLKSDSLVGMPTETVYGLAGNALSEAAILNIYKTKNRPKFDPLIAHIHTIDNLDGLVESIPEIALKLAEHFWPGPLTLLLDKSERIPDLLTSGLPRVAVRIPNHPLALSLLKQIDFPLAAPSANPFGYVSPTEVEHVNNQLGGKISYILNGGRCEVGLESTIVGFEEDRAVIQRLGGINIEEIEEIAGKVKIQVNNSSNLASPGMLKSHYSPGKKILLGDVKENLKRTNNEKVGIISFDQHYDIPSENQFLLSPEGSLEEAARNIFQALRHMDNPNIEIILADYVSKEGLGLAINDRLSRAAAG